MQINLRTGKSNTKGLERISSWQIGRRNWALNI